MSDEEAERLIRDALTPATPVTNRWAPFTEAELMMLAACLCLAPIPRESSLLVAEIDAELERRVPGYP